MLPLMPNVPASFPPVMVYVRVSPVSASMAETDPTAPPVDVPSESVNA